MAENPLPVPVPPVSPETAPFWEATAEGRLLLTRCDGCSAVVWYPRSHCPLCGSSTSWIEGSGRGTVYSWTLCRRGEGAYADAGPYVLAYVELDEGPRVMTNIVGCDPGTLSIGDPVVAVFQPTGSGPAVLRFRPV